MESLHLRVIKTGDGLLAQCLDNPVIMVSGKNKTEIRKNLKEIITGYVEAFPGKKPDFFKNEKMVKAIFRYSKNPASCR